MRSEKIKVVIPPSILSSFRNRGLTWEMILCELIDNSFDANASSVCIDFETKRKMIVSDDGDGCDSIHKMLTIGRHYRTAPMKKTILGRYGVGLKEAACALWSTLQISTSRNGDVRDAAVDFPKLSTMDEWDIADASINKATSETHKGTVLVFSGMKDKEMPHDIQLLCENLGYIYGPAIQNGKQIRVVTGSRKRRTFLVKAWELPETTKMVKKEISVNGKNAMVTIGILPIGSKQMKKIGFRFSYGDRVITTSAIGARDMSMKNVCGTVELHDTGKKWRLSTNKTDITDDQDALSDAIWLVSKEILEEAAGQQDVIKNSKLETEINAMLQAMLGSSSRGKGTKKGTVTPTGKGTKHKSKNNRKGKGRLNGVVMERVAKGADSPIAEYESLSQHLYMNEDHPWMSNLYKENNTDAIVTIGLQVLVSTLSEQQNTGIFDSMKDYTNIVDMLSELLGNQGSENTTA